MGEAGARGADRVYLTSDNPRSESADAILAEIAAGVRKVPGGAERTVVRVDRREAMTVALQEARAGDLVLIAGKGHERVQIIGQQRIPFDDREVAREVLRELGHDK
jgi:UDP-N-acetylmuramoyl-L-alanyl-D-glutamate--2,6-diaminopimelate ligase